MKNIRFFIASLMVLCTVFIFSCRKKDFTSSQTLSSKQSTAKDFSGLMASGTCISDYDAGNGYDSVLKPTILGYHLQNHPYSLTNMQQAYYNLYGSTSGVALTHKYVRFKPSTPAQLSTLVDLDIDLFDHPLDYEVVQEGDCVPDGPPPPTFTRQPSGTIRVEDNNLNTFRGVRNVRVLAKRFLKIERTYTNTQGQFFLNKEFNKARIYAEFKNDQAIIRALRRARLWQTLDAVERDFGLFKGELNDLQLNIPYNADALSRSARYWAATTAHNTVQEYRDFAAQQNIGLPPDKLRILLTNWKLQGVSGAAPMFAKRFWQGLPAEFLTTFVVSNMSVVAGGLTALTIVLKSEIDITAGYNLGGNNITASSEDLSGTLLHEQAHATHYNKVSNNWWATFVNAEISEMIAGPFPYGDGTHENSKIIALGESWAYHIGHFMTDLKYGSNSGGAVEQGILYGNGPIWENGILVANTGLNTHLNLLEDFSSARVNDNFRWIPQGLYYDLMDNRNDGNQFPLRVALNDAVFGYTNQQFFNALG